MLTYRDSVWSSNRVGVPEAKAALRERILETRAALDAAALAHAARDLRDAALETPEICSARRVAAYISVGREPGTGPLIHALTMRDVEVLLPILLPGGEVGWAPYSGPDGLVAATRGLLEPVTPPIGPDAVTTADVVLVPGLAADRQGSRLGRGGGSYDRVLARVAGRAFTCVVLHEGEVLDMPLPKEAHDVPVHACLTPSGLHRLR